MTAKRKARVWRGWAVRSRVQRSSFDDSEIFASKGYARRCADDLNQVTDLDRSYVVVKVEVREVRKKRRRVKARAQ